MKYKILESHNRELLEKEVNDFIRTHPALDHNVQYQHAATSSPHGMVRHYYSAMIRYAGD